MGFIPHAVRPGPPKSIPCLLGAGGMTTAAASPGWEKAPGWEEEKEEEKEVEEVEDLRTAQVQGGRRGRAVFCPPLSFCPSVAPLGRAAPDTDFPPTPHRHRSARLLCRAGLCHKPGPSPGGPPGSPRVDPTEMAGRRPSTPPPLTGAPPSPPSLTGHLQNTAKTPEKGAPREVSKPPRFRHGEQAPTSQKKGWVGPRRSFPP